MRTSTETSSTSKSYIGSGGHVGVHRSQFCDTVRVTPISCRHSLTLVRIDFRNTLIHSHWPMCPLLLSEFLLHSPESSFLTTHWTTRQPWIYANMQELVHAACFATDLETCERTAFECVEFIFGPVRKLIVYVEVPYLKLRRVTGHRP